MPANDSGDYDNKQTGYTISKSVWVSECTVGVFEKIAKKKINSENEKKNTKKWKIFNELKIFRPESYRKGTKIFYWNYESVPNRIKTTDNWKKSKQS